MYPIIIVLVRLVSSDVATQTQVSNRDTTALGIEEFHIPYKINYISRICCELLAINFVTRCTASAGGAKLCAGLSWNLGDSNMQCKINCQCTFSKKFSWKRNYEPTQNDPAQNLQTELINTYLRKSLSA